MADFYELDFLAVETKKSGDAITMRYQMDGRTLVHVVDGGFLDTGETIVKHLEKYYGSRRVDHVVLTHTDQDHANGLRAVLEKCDVGCLWMNRPWKHAAELLRRFPTYNYPHTLESKLRRVYAAAAELEEIAAKNDIEVKDAFQGQMIGAFRVLTPTKQRYLQLVTDSEKTPVTESYPLHKAAMEEAAFKDSVLLEEHEWGYEHFPEVDTSSENEMSLVQFAELCGRRILLTGDSGRDGLTEAADYLERQLGKTLPGVRVMQVPHHGGRRNVTTEILDRWLGKPLSAPPAEPLFRAVCSSAKADKHHPKMSVKRAFMHRGAKWLETEGISVWLSYPAMEREGYSSIAQATYPSFQERD